MIKKEEVYKLKKQGLSVLEIGKIFNVTHQAISFVLNKYYPNEKFTCNTNKKISFNCKKCNKEVFVVKSRKWRKFCSLKCYRNTVKENSMKSTLSPIEITKYHTDRMKKYRMTNKGKINTRVIVYRSIQKYSKKQKAREALSQALRKKIIVKPKICSVCTKIVLIHVHHEDYSQPLKVVWLCPRCHKHLHMGKLVL